MAKDALLVGPSVLKSGTQITDRNYLGLFTLNFSALFCLPPKCGTTSYQRALASQLTKEFLSYNIRQNQYKMSDRREMWLMNQAKASFNGSKIADLIGKRQLTSDEITSPAVYHFMNNFIPSAIVNPQAGIKNMFSHNYRIIIVSSYHTLHQS